MVPTRERARWYWSPFAAFGQLNPDRPRGAHRTSAGTGEAVPSTHDLTQDVDDTRRCATVLTLVEQPLQKA